LYYKALSAMKITIVEAKSEAHFAQFAEIIAEYLIWLRLRYQDQKWMIDQVATAQSLDDELNDLSSRYSMPFGVAFVAEVDDALAGAGAWRRQANGICEMKRVFIRDAFKGLGAGRKLCEAIMQSAREHGYTLMRLDTGKRMTEAQDLYRKLGFSSCQPYQDYPPNILVNMEFMQASLQN
jgi:ribosomal protein S18 acetylase RimI-like enzyme